jgi:hypothetical protein
LSRYCGKTRQLSADPPANVAALELLWKLSKGLPYLIQLLSGTSFRLARDHRSPIVTAWHVEQAHEQLRQQKPHLF